MSDPVQWPAAAIDDLAKDLAKPTASLLQRLRVLETKEDVRKGTSLLATPPSLQAITAGAFDSTKISSLFAGFGGLGGASAAAWAAFEARTVAVQVALVGAVAVILAAGLLSIAVIVRSDMQSRAEATAAQYRARAAIAASFVTMAGLSQKRAHATTDATPPQEANGAGVVVGPVDIDEDDAVVVARVHSSALLMHLASQA